LMYIYHNNNLYVVMTLFIGYFQFPNQAIRKTYRVKHAYAGTSIKQSPVLKGHLSLVRS